jgi:hypothetical protein
MINWKELLLILLITLPVAGCSLFGTIGTIPEAIVPIETTPLPIPLPNPLPPPPPPIKIEESLPELPDIKTVNNSDGRDKEMPSRMVETRASAPSRDIVVLSSAPTPSPLMKGPEVKKKKKPKVTQVDRGMSDFVFGQLGYIIPAVMKFAEPTRVTVRVSKTALENFSSSVLGKTKDAKVENIKVYTFMAVKLVGEPEFLIRALTTEQQPVSSLEDTQWDFDVTPRKLGVNKLTVRVSARLKLKDGSVETKDLPIYTKDIYVKATPPSLILDWFSNYWQWLITTLVGGSGIGWIFSKKKEKEKGE